MGLPYPILDQILNGFILRMSTSDIADNVDHTVVSVDEMERAGFDPPVTETHVRNVISKVRSSRHKRKSLAIPKLGLSTIGLDMRERW
jgi:hypothetical protein